MTFPLATSFIIRLHGGLMILDSMPDILEVACDDQKKFAYLQ